VGDGSELTDRERQALAAFHRLVAGRGACPTGAELGAAMGLSVPHHGRRYLVRLADLGYVRRAGAGSRAYRPVPDPAGFALPVLGPSAAGRPLEAFEPGADRFSFTERFGRPGSFMVTVRGDSMVGAGIFDGDLAVLRSVGAAADGQTVLCRVARGHTLKVYRKRGRKVWLEARNPDVAPIEPTEADELEMLGVLIGTVRLWA
jgi:repressor LexA